MHLNNKFSCKIAELRKHKGLTQEQMAEKLEMSVPGYAKIERGVSSINLKRLEQIAQILAVDLVSFIYFSNNDAMSPPVSIPPPSSQYD
ncbi:helix-turn-helix domain-containing protein [Gallibacterium salpingitidis]|uniref:helix-turn-helix domain-containing protein n=1 Tax=Gallibacterium salpingitidis TaxID=505341 RepID=UPI000825053A|nr:helix-turn-helix transcriptional regulator [Gallibacterium salpingitidis]